MGTKVMNRSDDPLVKTTLIVAPTALLDQWKLEIETKTNMDIQCHIYHGPSKAKTKKLLQKYDIVLTTFMVRLITCSMAQCLIFRYRHSPSSGPILKQKKRLPKGRRRKRKHLTL